MNFFNNNKSQNLNTINTSKNKRNPFNFKIVFRKKFFKRIIISFLVLMASSLGIVVGLLLSWISTATPLSDEDLNISSQTTFIYDSNNKEIAKLVGEENKNMIIVPSDKIPLYIKNAFIAIEDQRFKFHKGVDLLGIINGALSQITNGYLRGGSTITQQVVKNLTGNDERNAKRKVQEIWRALDLEKRRNKDEILTLYCNIIYFGNACYGVESASQLYFGKQAKDLSLTECTALASIPCNPSEFTPLDVINGKYTNVEANNQRRVNVVLKKMLDQKMISKEEYEKSISETPKFIDPSKLKNKVTQSKQSYFVDQVVLDVKKDLMKKKNIDENTALRQIYSGGLHIYTTCNSEIQNSIDRIFCDEDNFKSDIPREEHSQAAIVVLEPNTGHIVGLYGGFGEKKGATFNRATQGKRSPGSCMKPITVYGPGINEGIYTAATVVDDAPAFLNPQTPNEIWPTNFVKNQFYGLTTIRTAITYSHNISAVKLYKNLPPAIALEKYLLPCGIDLRNENYLSVCLGGLTNGLTPLQMAGAYIPFANEGTYVEPSTYTKVLDSKKRVLLEKKPDPKEIYTPETAFIMTSMLEDVVKLGTAAGIVNVVNNEGEIISSAGKTGSSQFCGDKWFCGYTPYYLATVWYGYDHNLSIEGEEMNNAMKIWNKCMNEIHKNLETKNFPQQPEGVVKAEVCPKSGYRPTSICKNACQPIYEYFNKNNIPDKECDVHVEALICKESKKLASDKCPLSDVEKVTLTDRTRTKQVIEPFINALSKTYQRPRDWEYEMPENLSICDIHNSSNKRDTNPTRSPSQQDSLDRDKDKDKNKKPGILDDLFDIFKKPSISPTPTPMQNFTPSDKPIISWFPTMN